MDAVQPRGKQELCGSVAVRRCAGATVLHLSGEIDAAVVWRFLEEHGEPEPVDAIDTDEVTFLCAHGAGLIADWSRTAAAAGRPAALRRPPRPVQRVLELTGWAEAVTVPAPRVPS